MRTLTVATQHKDQVIDLTERLAEYLRDEAERDDGTCLVFAAHTTCAVTTADLDPGTDLDFLQAIRALLPPLAFRHPHDPAHAPDHILAALIGPSISVPYAHRRPLLGTWQRVVLIELNGPRQRTLHLTAL
jgi:secondary thiamine-phosphate synthase enzyme